MIDDDATLAGIYRFGLERAGLRVTVLTDPAKLAQTLAREVPDVIVLDWNLPPITGAEVLSRLRHDKRATSVPVVIFSNLDGADGLSSRAIAAGASAWLVKVNTSPAQLAERLKSVLSGVQQPTGRQSQTA